MKAGLLRRAMLLYLLLLPPVAWLAMRFSPYGMDGDGVSYMDIADLIRTHRWAGVVNGYWHPLYPAGLAAANLLLHPTRMRELGAYYILNFFVFLGCVVAMLAFTSALVRLRTSMRGTGSAFLLRLDALRLLGVGLVVIAAQRELGLDKIRPDALLEALMLLAFAMLLNVLATDRLVFASWMGLFFGLAYLTKSFAFVVALLSIALLVAFQAMVQRRGLVRSALSGALALTVFAAVAGPYVVALSMQKHRPDFGDSGALNYAWFAGGTEKLHLKPGTPERYGSATVDLKHPVRQLLANPPIYSYKAELYGTYPDWFDPTYFNERIVPHLNPRVLLHRDLRNLALIVRYLLNHPEAWLLLCLLLILGARFSHWNRGPDWRDGLFWLPPVALGTAMVCLYGLVNVEERYVTLAYLVTILPMFASLRMPGERSSEADGWVPRACSAMVVLLAFLALGETLRVSLERRRLAAASGLPTWYMPQIYGAAQGLARLGVRPGDEVACMESIACVNDPYWARLAGVRILTEVFNSGTKNLLGELGQLPDRDRLYQALRDEQAKVLVAWFAPGTMNTGAPAARGWVQLGETGFWAFPLNLPAQPAQLLPPPQPWSAGNTGP